MKASRQVELFEFVNRKENYLLEKIICIYIYLNI